MSSAPQKQSLQKGKPQSASAQVVLLFSEHGFSDAVFHRDLSDRHQYKLSIFLSVAVQRKLPSDTLISTLYTDAHAALPVPCLNFGKAHIFRLHIALIGIYI